MRPSILLALSLLAGSAAAEPRVLRLAAIAPDGTSWARELKAFARAVETDTHGELKLKFYLGGIAGDEMTALERVRRGQLDGEAGAIFCQALAPSMRVLRLPGLFESHDEAQYVMGLLRGNLDGELGQSGFALLGVGGFGFDVIFSRAPIRSWAELKQGRVWVWSLDPIWQAAARAMGLSAVATPVENAAKAFDEQHLDAFIAAPTAALAYQWATLAHAYTVLETAFLPGCMVVSNRAFDALPLDQREVLKTAAAKFFARFNDLNRTMEDQLLGKLFEKQGLKKVTPPEAMRAEFAQAARAARLELGPELAPRPLLDKVNAWLDELRLHKRAGAAR